MNGMIVYNLLYNIATDYRVKSIQLAFFKYNRYYPDHQTRKVFDDLLGFRTEYSYAAEPPVQFRLSHLSRRSEPL